MKPGEQFSSALRVLLQIFFEVFEALLRKGGMLFVLGAGFVGTAAVGSVDVYRRIIVWDAALTSSVE